MSKVRTYLTDLTDAIAWFFFVVCFAAGAFGLCVFLFGCDAPPRYNPAQRDAILAEEEARAMNEISSRGHATENDWRAYNKRQYERLERLRREIGVH